MLTHYRFGTVNVLVWPHRWHLVTLFSDGTKVDACPQPTIDYLAHAHQLGYTGLSAAWQMCREHELRHTWLAYRNGTISQALWAVAHGHSTDTDAIRDEEALVLASQARLPHLPIEEFRVDD